MSFKKTPCKRDFCNFHLLISKGPNCDFYFRIFIGKNYAYNFHLPLRPCIIWKQIHLAYLNCCIGYNTNIFQLLAYTCSNHHAMLILWLQYSYSKLFLCIQLWNGQSKRTMYTLYLTYFRDKKLIIFWSQVNFQIYQVMAAFNISLFYRNHNQNNEGDGFEEFKFW